MSTYLTMGKHPILNQWYPVICIDDHFAHHRYGMRFIFPEEDMVDSNVFGKHHKDDYYISDKIIYDPRSYDIETSDKMDHPEYASFENWIKILRND